MSMPYNQRNRMSWGYNNPYHVPTQRDASQRINVVFEGADRVNDFIGGGAASVFNLRDGQLSQPVRNRYDTGTVPLVSRKGLHRGVAKGMLVALALVLVVCLLTSTA